jgi:hypothetical protein
MWSWLICFLSGRHEYGISCGHDAVFLRCVHCGRRKSQGWALGGAQPHAQARKSGDVATIPPQCKVDTARTARGQ